MRYRSTRQALADPTTASFEEILLAGLAPDGGLYVPESWPCFSTADWRRLAGRPYHQVAAAVMAPFLGDMLPMAELEALLEATYRDFTHPAVAPLRQLGPDRWLLDLTRGPTIAFKDYALQAVGRLFDAALARRGERVTIIGATSGDTGSAAMEACRDRDNVDLFILYPDGRPSPVQTRQMTGVASPHVHAIAVEGSFDDCQDLVKAMFADTAFRTRLGLSAVNSINWARIVGQVVYYVTAALALGAPDRPVAFAVPTGNFGNVYAGHVARLIGLPVAGLVIGTNRNDILYRFIETGRMTIGTVEPSLSPSMDIQVSSNFERLLFEVSGRDGSALAAAMTRFRETGELPVTAETWERVRALFRAHRVDDQGTRATIARIWAETGELVDPHTAIAIATAEALPAAAGIPTVALACAHPAKFPEVVTEVTGQHPALPAALADLMSRPERVTRLPNRLGPIQDFIATRARRGEGAS